MEAFLADWAVGLPLVSVVTLLIAAFLGSLLTSSLGVGGGAFLITVMAGIVPPVALIPVHGIVQLGSNSSRAWLTRKHTQWTKIGWFAAGAAIASLLTVFLLGKMQPGVIPLLVGLFILWLSWGKVPEIGLGEKTAGLFSGGLITTLLTMLVGATGPLVSAWLGRAGTDRWQYTANFSTCMTLQHLLKVAVFGLAGFAFLPWIPLLAAMILCGYIGTRLGLKLMGKMPETLFRQLFRWILTLLALRLIWVWYAG
ncbi:sulfite exporter TauE/SafE family protein [Thalassolituus sp. LLYu03]|uniref:sulfite exporter TauE/SafE family protein n=1 Tax=Thalassolituus sp. LLYu03 TaxID=3421656 RepID=UPI003D2A890E